VYNGNVVYGDSTNLPLTSVTIDGSLRKDNPINFSAAKSYLESLSASLKGYTVTGTSKFEWGQVSVTGADPYLNVFSVDGSELSKSNDFQINVPNGSAALVNISGKVVSWAGGHEINGTVKNNVLYNFYEADTLKISGIDVRGSILAPKTNVIFSTGVQNGQIICKSLISGGQTNNCLFKGNIPVEKSITNIASVKSCGTTDSNTGNNSSSVVITPKAPSGCTVPSSGKEWKELGSFTKGEMIYTITKDSSAIYTGTVGGKIYKSSDAGLTWNRINSDMNVGWIWSLCFNNGKLFASTEKGVFKLSEGAWNKTGQIIKASKDTLVDVRALTSHNGKLYAGTWGYGVYASEDNGTSWRSINDGLFGSDAVQTLTFNDKGDLFAGTFNGGFFTLENGQSTWKHTPVGSNLVWSLCYSNGSLYAALLGDGLYSSTDNGATWSLFEDLDMPYVYSIVADENGVIYASSWTSGVFCSVNSGASFSSLGMGGNGVSSLLVNGSSPSVSGKLLKANTTKKTVIAGTKEGTLYLLDLTDLTGVNEDNKAVPSSFNLSQNYPNPFNPSTNIKVSIPKEGKYSLKVYNVLGQEITTLLSGEMKAGVHTLHFDGSRLSSGIYIYRLTGSGVNLTKKMMMIK
jgi:choice-of-anchor A domain-containing protein